MSIKTQPSKAGIIIAIILMIFGVVVFQKGWFVDWLGSDKAPVGIASAAEVSGEPSAGRVAPYASTGNVLKDMSDPKFDVNEAYRARKAVIDRRIDKHWAKWREGDKVDDQGRPQVTVFAWDRRGVEDMLFNTYAVTDRGEDGAAYIRGPDGARHIPQFMFVANPDEFTAIIGNSSFDDFLFQFDGTTLVSVIARNKKGIVHDYSIIAYKSETGKVVFLKDQALQMMDLIMTSDSLIVSIPSYSGHHDMEFDTKSFDAKPFIRMKDFQ